MQIPPWLAFLALIAYPPFAIFRIVMRWSSQRANSKIGIRNAPIIRSAIDELRGAGKDYAPPLLTFDYLVNLIRSRIPGKYPPDFRVFIHHLWGSKETLTSEVTRAKEIYVTQGFNKFIDEYDEVVSLLAEGKFKAAFEELGSVYSLALTAGEAYQDLDELAEKDTARNFFIYSNSIMQYSGILLSEEIEARFKSSAPQMQDFWSRLSPLSVLSWGWLRYNVYQMRIGWRINRFQNRFMNWAMATEEEIISLYTLRIAVGIAEYNKEMVLSSMIKGFSHYSIKLPYYWVLAERFFLASRLRFAGVEVKDDPRSETKNS